MTNKYLFILAVLVSITTGLQAQRANDDNAEGVTFGGKAGVNISNVWDSNTQDFVARSKAGFAAGFFIGIPIGEYLGIQPEILYSQKGFRGSGTLLGSPYSFSRTSAFIDFPLQLQFRTSQHLTLVAGPQYSYLISEKNVFTNSLFTTEQEQAFENDNIRKNILGIVGGGDISISHLVLSARAGLDLINNKGDGSSNTPRYKNAWLQFTIGIKM